MAKDDADKLPKGAFATGMVMIFGALPPMLDTTIVNVAINGLAREFDTTLATMQWATTAYVLALGITVPFAGWLVRRLDGKLVFMGALAFFVIGSLLSGLAWSPESLIVFRIIQGLAAGVIMPTISVLAVGLAGGSQNLGKLMSLLGIPIVFAPIVGPVVGGLIMEYLPWHWLFFINLPLGIIGLIVLAWRLPKSPADDKSVKLDWVGVGLLALASATLVYGVTQVVKTDSRTTGIEFLAVGGVAIIGYAIYALRRSRDGAEPTPHTRTQPLIPLSMFRSKNFSAAFISLFLAGFATNGPMLLFPMFFQNVKELSVIISALWLVPQGLGMLITRPFIGKWTDRFGARLVVLPALAVTLLATLPFAFFTASSSAWWVWVALLVRGAGVGGVTVPLMADAYVGVDKPLVPAASVATRMIQNIGGAFGSAVLATVVANFILAHATDLTGAYHAGFVTSLIFMVVSVIPAFFLTNKLAHKATTTPSLSPHTTAEQMAPS